MKWGTIFLLVLAVLSIAFAPQIVEWFRDDPDVVAVGTVALRCQAAVMPLMATTVMCNMMLQSMGKGLKASISSSARNGICFIPLILILPRILGITGVEIAQTVADVISVFISVPLAWTELKEMNEASITK